MTASAATLASGCCLLRRDPIPPCFGEPPYASDGLPLIVDPHAHFFNGRDLQVKAFFNLVVCRRAGEFERVCQLFGGVFRVLAWLAAPDAKRETAILRSLNDSGGVCSAEKQPTSDFLGYRAEVYPQARAELQAAAAEVSGPVVAAMPGISTMSAASLSALSSTPEALGVYLINNLPETYEEYEGDYKQASVFSEFESLESFSVTSALDFVLEMFQYRMARVSRYYADYGSGDQKLDLIATSLVDYDWPIAKGKSTMSTLSEQMETMREICILSGGRVHPMAPFDPYREVAHQLGRSESSLEFVQQAVMSGLAIGVKLYPPMGFGPTKNAGRDPSFWVKPWSSDIVRTPNFGKRLDDAMNALFEWCAENDVPIITHSNRSNGPSDDFEDLVAPCLWKPVVDRFPDLSINFAHLGGVGSGKANDDWEGYISLMKDSGPGSRVFVDASYFSDIIADDPEVATRLLKRLLGSSEQLERKILYGSDWKMLVQEENAETYLKTFAEAAEKVEQGGHADFSERVLGGSAANWLGLSVGRGNRERMLRFYQNNNVVPPPWVSKAR